VITPFTATRELLYRDPLRPSIDRMTTVVRELVAAAGVSYELNPGHRPPPQVELRDGSPMAVPWAGRVFLQRSSVEEDYRRQLVYNAAHEAQHYACLGTGPTATWSKR
jgi:hypothetical protein